MIQKFLFDQPEQITNMKQLHEYDTPENQRLTNAMNGEDDAVHLIALDALSHSLEQRLAASRDAFQEIITCTNNCNDALDEAEQMERIARETLTLTAPK